MICILNELKQKSQPYPHGLSDGSTHYQSCFAETVKYVYSFSHCCYQEAWGNRIPSCRIRLVSFVLPCIGYTTRPYI